MPRIQRISQHRLIGRSSARLVVCSDEPQKSFFLILRNKGKGPDQFFCGHCGQTYPAMRIAHDLVADPNPDEANVQIVPHGEGFTGVPLPPSPPPVGEKAIVAFRCQNPDCNQVVSASIVDIIDQTQKGSFTHVPVWAGHYDEGKIVRFKWIMKKVTAWQGKLQVVYTHHLVIFNPYTGNTYRYAPYENHRRAKWYDGPNIRTCTYDTSPLRDYLPADLPAEIYEDLYLTLRRKVEEHLGYPPIDLHAAALEQARKKALLEQQKDLRLQVRRNHQNPAPFHIPTPQIHANMPSMELETMALFIRFPNMSPFEMDPIIRRAYTAKQVNDKEEKKYPVKYRNSMGELVIVKGEFVTEKRTHVIKRISPWVSKLRNNESNPIGKMMELHKIPNIKTYRKVLAKEPFKIFSIAFVMKHFKETSNIVRIVDSGLFKASDQDLDKPLNYQSGQTLSTFIQEMIAMFGETIFVNKLLHNDVPDYVILRDAARIYYQIRKKRPLLDIDCRGNIHEMHQRFSQVLDSIDHPNYELEYDEFVQSLHMEQDGFVIRPAVDTNELRYVGRTMRICVGGYADRAYAKDCHIVLVTQEDRYLMCIELNSDGHLVKQTKLNCNRRPQTNPVLHKLVTDWITAKKLLVDTYDIPELAQHHAKTIEEYNRKRMLDNFNPVDIEVPDPIVLQDEPVEALEPDPDPFERWQLRQMNLIDYDNELDPAYQRPEPHEIPLEIAAGNPEEAI